MRGRCRTCWSFYYFTEVLECRKFLLPHAEVSALPPRTFCRAARSLRSPRVTFGVARRKVRPGRRMFPASRLDGAPPGSHWCSGSGGSLVWQGSALAHRWAQRSTATQWRRQWTSNDRVRPRRVWSTPAAVARWTSQAARSQRCPPPVSSLRLLPLRRSASCAAGSKRLVPPRAPGTGFPPVPSPTARRLLRPGQARGDGAPARPARPRGSRRQFRHLGLWTTPVQVFPNAV